MLRAELRAHGSFGYLTCDVFVWDVIVCIDEVVMKMLKGSAFVSLEAPHSQRVIYIMCQHPFMSDTFLLADRKSVV